VIPPIDQFAAPALTLEKWLAPGLVEHIRQGAMLVNRDHADLIMAKYRLDGLVAALPANIYYLSSHLGISGMMGRHYSSFAVLPRNREAPASLIINGSMVYHLDYRPTWMPNIEVFSYPTGQSGQDGRPLAEPLPSPWARVVRENSLTGRDRLLLALYAQFEGKTAVSAAASLAKALGKAGLLSATVGFDDMRVPPCLGADFSGKAIDALNIFREIRMVKSEPEIAILREAAMRNEAALDAAIATMHVGQPLQDVDIGHQRKWGELGGKSLWLIVNQRGLNSGVIEKDEPTKIDSVGEYLGYKGDVGRTVVVGSPSDEVERRAEANTAALAALYAAIRPGMRFAEGARIVNDVLRQHGIERPFCGAHPVGLDHTDQPVPVGHETDFQAFDDVMVFEEGTVFTMDMPYHEIGYGTSHVEDMMVVRPGGAEALSSGDTSLRIIPA
jgi:Xaa-Pro dipeptidase